MFCVHQRSKIFFNTLGLYCYLRTLIPQLLNQWVMIVWFCYYYDLFKGFKQSKIKNIGIRDILIRVSDPFVKNISTTNMDDKSVIRNINIGECQLRVYILLTKRSYLCVNQSRINRNLLVRSLIVEKFRLMVALTTPKSMFKLFDDIMWNSFKVCLVCLCHHQTNSTLLYIIT